MAGGGGRQGRWRGLTFLATDHLGTPACALAGDASVTWSGGFEPFGRDWQHGTPEGALASGLFLRLPGQWDHPYWHRDLRSEGFGADLFYNVHRWYEAGTGRYVSADPLPMQFREDYSTFLYTESNPLVGSDPLGLCEFRPCSSLSGPPPTCSCDRPRVKQAAAGETGFARLFCAYRNSPEVPPGVPANGSPDPCDPRVLGNVQGPGGSPQFKPQGDPCLEWCTCQHERQHAQDLRDPRVARMIVTGTPTRQVANWLECRAYTVGSFCLTGYASGGQP
ncbi:MAG: hypothetical protein M5U13_07905 [Thermoanaerobaculia bacterium]|nr:hypothetical protein [Thermoanaerobaculia bacterium]